jgi:4'-phosphopantetheinyl transferase
VRLRLLSVTQPVLRPDAKRSGALPLATIRAEFERGAAQAVFLALGDLPDALPPNILTEEEEARARAAPVRRGFIAGRWLLRAVLAALTGTEPRSLALRSGAHGKLFLSGFESLAAAFNLSHSGELAALVLMRDRRVGIDIEATRPLTDAELLARRILGPRERRLFAAAAEVGRTAVLLEAWTRKEAVLKAMGTGISGGLSSIEVLTGVGDPVVLRAGEPPASWSVRTVPMPPGYHGAFAVEGATPHLKTWQAVPTVHDD